MHATAVAVSEPSGAGEARRQAVRLAESVGFGAEAAGKVALAVTEAANNLHLHAGSGELLLRTLDEGGVGGLEVISLDRGPGMTNVDRCLVDGFSTLGTAGKGLGAMSRAADQFEISSAPGMGTVVLMRFWAAAIQPAQARLGAACINVPLAGEEVSGDGFAFRLEPAGGGTFLLVDGLGHGSGAATAALEAVRCFKEEAPLPPVTLLEVMHDRLRPTRGAAAAVAMVDLEAGRVRYAGVGNVVSTLVVPGKRTNLVSMNGTLGHRVQKVQEFSYPWTPGSLLVMHTDGVSTQWNLDNYPGLIRRHPSLISATLYRDFRRLRDDAAVLTASEVVR